MILYGIRSFEMRGFYSVFSEYYLGADSAPVIYQVAVQGDDVVVAEPPFCRCYVAVYIKQELPGFASDSSLNCASIRLEPFFLVRPMGSSSC